MAEFGSQGLHSIVRATFKEYTVVDTDRVILVLFIGNHDDAAAYLRGKKSPPPVDNHVLQ